MKRSLGYVRLAAIPFLALALFGQAALACCTSDDDCFVGFHCYAVGDCNVIVPRFASQGRHLGGSRKEGRQKQNGVVSDASIDAAKTASYFGGPQASVVDKKACIIPGK